MKTLLNNMAMTVKAKFDSAHRILGYEGECQNLHGHTYHLEVTVSRDNPNEIINPETEMVVDFRDLKKIVNDNVVEIYDHAYISTKEDPLLIELANKGMKVVRIESPWGPKRSTAETIVIDIANRLTGPLVSARLFLDRVKLWETENCSVELFR